MSRKVVIWGDDHHNALGLLRMLGGRGYDILFLVHGLNHKIATASKYCEKYVIVKSIDEGLSYLYENYKDKDNKAVLLFTADRYSEAANTHLSQLKDFFFVAGPSKQGLLAEIDDKYMMGKIAEECGIKIPSTILYPQDDLLSLNEYPVVVKSCSPTSKDIKIKVVKNEEELLKTSKAFYPDRKYVIQKFIDKDADGLIYGCRNYDGKTILAGICVRNRWSDDGCGSFGYLTPDIPSYISISGIEKFLEKIDFYGLFSVEYALTNEDAYFYEFNLRNDGTSVLFYNAGSNLALSFVNSCFGFEEDIPTKIREKQYLMNEFWDHFNVKDGLITKEQWEKDRKKSTIFFYYDPDDMAPYNIQKSQRFTRSLKRLISNSKINEIRLMIRKRLMAK